MKTINEEVTTQLVEKKSKFISLICPISSVEEAEKKLKEIKKTYYDARHHCYAYRINNNDNIIEKASDDGEPSGTAGAPMLNLLVKNDLINVLVVVVRYFGGILLGTGGLVRAYTQSLQEAITQTKTINIEQGIKTEITISYQHLEYFKYYCQKNNINILDTKFNENVICIIEVSLNEKDKIKEEIEDNQIKVHKMKFLEATYIKKNT